MAEGQVRGKQVLAAHSGSNYTESDATIEGHLAGIDIALGTILVLSDTAPVDVFPRIAGPGSASEASRQDHGHDTVTAAPGSLTQNTSPLEGSASSLARSDHRHGVSTTATPSTCDASASSGGALNTFVRGDHAHQIAVGSPVAIGLANADGTSDNLTRADHVHDGTSLLSNTNPVDVNAQAADAGAATAASRQDHKHDVTIGSPIVLSVGDSAGAGAGYSLALADHVHGVPMGSPVAIGLANADGSSGDFSHSDHVHDGTAVGTAVLLWGASSTLTTTNKRYLLPGSVAAGNPPTTDNVRIKAPRAGVLKRMYVRHNTPLSGSTIDITYTLEVNGVSKALTVTLKSDATDGSDLVNSVAIATGDDLAVAMTKAGNLAGATNNPAVTMEFI